MIESVPQGALFLSQKKEKMKAFCFVFRTNRLYPQHDTEEEIFLFFSLLIQKRQQQQQQ